MSLKLKFYSFLQIKNVIIIFHLTITPIPVMHADSWMNILILTSVVLSPLPAEVSGSGEEAESFQEICTFLVAIL